MPLVCPTYQVSAAPAERTRGRRLLQTGAHVSPQIRLSSAKKPRRDRRACRNPTTWELRQTKGARPNMHVRQVLSRWLEQRLVVGHAKRVAALIRVVEALVHGGPR